MMKLKMGFFATLGQLNTDSDEIWDVSVDHVNLVSKIWPWSVRGGYRRPRQKAKLVTFGGVAGHAAGFAVVLQCFQLLV